MAYNWNRTGTITAVVGVVVAITFGIIQFWDQFFPSEGVYIEIEEIQWKMGDGRLGKGPYTILKLQISNNGSVPVILTKFLTKFALGSIESNSSSIDCDTRNFTWMGVPWDKLLRGPDYEEAVSIRVAPRDLVSEVVFFEPAAVLRNRDRENRSRYKIFSCLQIVAVDGDIDRQEIRIPMGWLAFDDNKIFDFARSGESIGKIIVFN